MLSRRDAQRGHRNRVFLIMASGGMACMLSSPSALPQAPQGVEGGSGQQAFDRAGLAPKI